MNIAQKFNEHPATVGETYGQHFLMAMGVSLAMLRAAFCCALHAVFPFLCEKSGSRCIEGLYERMVTNRSRLAERQASDAVEA
jgi:hypothetical protein